MNTKKSVRLHLEYDRAGRIVTVGASHGTAVDRMEMPPHKGRKIVEVAPAALPAGVRKPAATAKQLDRLVEHLIASCLVRRDGTIAVAAARRRA